MPRLRQYATNAERQAAYRSRRSTAKRNAQVIQQFIDARLMIADSTIADPEERLRVAAEACGVPVEALRETFNGNIATLRRVAKAIVRDGAVSQSIVTPLFRYITHAYKDEGHKPNPKAYVPPVPLCGKSGGDLTFDDGKPTCPDCLRMRKAVAPAPIVTPVLGECKNCMDGTPATEVVEHGYDIPPDHLCADCAKQVRQLMKVSENRRIGAKKAAATRRRRRFEEWKRNAQAMPEEIEAARNVEIFHKNHPIPAPVFVQPNIKQQTPRKLLGVYPKEHFDEHGNYVGEPKKEANNA